MNALILALSLTTAGDEALLKAYQKEFAYLAAQKGQLQKRLNEVKTRSDKQAKTLQKEVDALQGKVLRLTAEAEQAERWLDDSQRLQTTWQDSQDQLKSTVSQANHSLALTLELEEDLGNAGATVDTLLQTASTKLDGLSKVKRDAGVFFSTGGEKLDGTLVQFGGVATYGFSDTQSGALAPAGSGELKVWPELTSQNTAWNTLPETLTVFLYESLDRPVDLQPEKSWYEFVAAGGAVAWIIVLLGLAAAMMLVVRLTLLLRVDRNTRRVEQEITRAFTESREQAHNIARNSKTSIGRVLSAAFDGDAHAADDVLSQALLEESPRLKRFAVPINVCAAVAPLLGLLGTVSGMISTFEIITKFGTGDPKLLSSGISEALVTTQLGLMVAIPTLVLGTLLSAKGDALLAQFEKLGLRVLAQPKPTETEPQVRLREAS